MVSIAQNAKEGEMKKYIGIEDKKKSNPKKVAELKTTEQASHNSLFSKELKKKGWRFWRTRERFLDININDNPIHQPLTIEIKKIKNQKPKQSMLTLKYIRREKNQS